MVICLRYLLPKHVPWGFTICHLTCWDKRLGVLGLHFWNQLPESLKYRLSFQTFKKLLSDWFGSQCKCKVSSYLDNWYFECYYVVDLISDFIGLILDFYCEFCPFRIILFTLYLFKIFYPRMNKPNIHTNVIGISCFGNGLNDTIKNCQWNFFNLSCVVCYRKMCKNQV